MPEGVSSGDIINSISGQILSGPEDSIFDSMFDWIQNGVGTIIQAIADWWNGIWPSLKADLSNLWHIIIDPITATVNAVWNNLYSVYIWVSEIYTNVRNLIGQAWSTTTAAVGSAIQVIWSWVESVYTRVRDWITTTINTLWQWVSGYIVNLITTVSAYFKELWADIQGLVSDWGKNIAGFFAFQSNLISSFWSDWYKARQADFDNLTQWMKLNIVIPIAAWWDGFLAKLFDFGEWVGNLFDAIGKWFSVDIPGHSPRWTAILDGIGHWFATWFYEFPKFFFGNFPESVAYGLATSFSWVVDKLSPFVESFLDQLAGFATQLGHTSPDVAVQQARSLTSTGLLTITGLAGMTIAGELLHPLKNLGMGNIAAMIYDLTNYKVLTGAFVGALAAAAIVVPLRYYYNNVFRPQLPNKAEVMDMYGMDDIDRTQFNKLMGYQGIADSWLDIFADSSYVPPTLLSLSGLVTAGSFDRDLFADILRRRRVTPTLRPLLLDMYERKANADVKAYGLSKALNRLKIGYTTEEQCTAELQVLHASDKEIPSYLAATRLDYATDYTTDIITAYRDAVRAGNMSIDDFHTGLLDLGLVPERADALTLIEVVRVKPTAAKSLVAPPKAIYLTDQGKIELDTIRRKRRKELITRDEEIADLMGIGMPADYASDIADNDDIALAETQVVTISAPTPLYATPAGKTSISTIRLQRSHQLITRDEEIARLEALEMPEYYAVALADNDDVRLALKTPSQTG